MYLRILQIDVVITFNVFLYSKFLRILNESYGPIEEENLLPVKITGLDGQPGNSLLAILKV
jgi:hypothetical protein